jgi:hypothetical protein
MFLWWASIYAKEERLRARQVYTRLRNTPLFFAALAIIMAIIITIGGGGGAPGVLVGIPDIAGIAGAPGAGIAGIAGAPVCPAPAIPDGIDIPPTIPIPC